jgi:uncharacterized oxidoreductase
MNQTGNTILITGGTSGIGRALAEAFHGRGNQVIIVGRRKRLLDEIVAAHSGMRGICVDVRNPNELDALAQQIQAQFPNLNVLINNAGISRTEDLASDPIDTSISLSIVQTNVLAVLHLTASLLPILKRQPNATIMTTTSGLAFVPRANFPTYCATKAFLHSWIQSLRFQLRNTSVAVLELAPPYVQTELAGPAQATDPSAMGLADYIGEVMRLLEQRDQAIGEILVQRVQPLRWAERDGAYEQLYAALNVG